MASVERRRLKAYPLLILLELGDKVRAVVGKKYIDTGFTILQSMT